MSDVQVSLETSQGLERRLRVKVPAGRIDHEVETRIRSAGRTVNLKGFRRGKVPTQVIRQRFGAQIRQEVVQDVVQASYSEALAQNNLRPAGLPRIEADKADTGEDFSYTAVFEVFPEFEVAGIENFSIEKPETEVTEADIDRAVDSLRRQKGTWQSVERESTRGDRVVIDFTGSLNGEAIDGGQAEKLGVIIGEGRMLADFETALERLLAGSRKSFPVRFPADYHDKKLSDQVVTFDVVVHEVQELELPAVNQDFISGLGVSTGDHTEFRDLVRQNLERQAASRIEAEVKRQIIEHLLSANPVDVPLTMISREAEALQAEGMRNLGIKDLEDAPALEAYEDIAKRRVRLRLIIGALIREKDIRLDQEKVDLRLDELCRSYEKPAEVRKLYLQNPDLMLQIENSVMEDQVMSWLNDKGQITPRSVAFSDLVGA